MILPIVRIKDRIGEPSTRGGGITPPGSFQNLFGNTSICSACLAVPYTSYIVVTGLGQSLTWTIESGSLPPGLTFHGGFNTDGRVLIDGVPTNSGNYSITVKAINPVGDFELNTFTISILGITTIALPDFEIGTPYSYQLEATGGTGVYSWAITSGALPDGLTLSIGGLISGTPSAPGTNPMIFRVIDLACEISNPSVFPPRVVMTTASQTKIATVLGYPEYISSLPPKKYHKLTWTGTSEQHGVDVATESHDVVGARYVWSGVGEIDGQGNQISNYRKDFYQECPSAITYPSIDIYIGYPPSSLFSVKGYCWHSDPASCSVCDPSLPFSRNVASNSGGDITDLLDDPTAGTHVTTPISTQNVSTSRFIIGLAWLEPATRPADFPLSTLNGIRTAWVIIDASHDYMATLSDEYTDAEALANAYVVNSNGSTAENFPRTTGYVSRFTTVDFELDFTGLVLGAAYVATVTFQADDFSTTKQTYNFTADSDTHTITDSIPQPPAGHTLAVKTATIAFA